MYHKLLYIKFLLVGIILLSSTSVSGSVLINELLADPAADLTGDANNDGMRSGIADEFVELVNNNDIEADISAWSISDSVSVRHIFPSNTILQPYTFLVVFGGGSPLLSEVQWQTASSGSLGFNNGGDTVSLFDSDSILIDEFTYGSIGDNDQSITLYPDGSSTEFTLHSTIEEADGALFSPGRSVASELVLAIAQENEPDEQPVIPEWPTLIYFGMGWGSVLLGKHKIF